ncbi:MAG: hypothetical protein COW24_00485 [Candidatus Kerfeldbacteria bacterium CG15_BIG_FIL_POST_REV_8_21_14_020_45_12]|uniref:Glycerophosphoryl diester phosphodiesterase membrane domain-containing protein n=1 Tax=Candidatus Kerfeldbacteria bacterium CG15_BIG_FIL_POST_REV_8_21_14_020_45_12 TaxID=2014247 RepID=A0A2M7H587_9BACT|nr:MAG: hypothetical protein COW24_00485 [Candidatus Kerfeldbacteria bacterium CG15_BIG_FIL_POST_REV_8_21_14_020_45_12]
MGKGMEIESFFTNIDLFRSSLSPLSPRFWDAGGWSTVLTVSGGHIGTFALLLMVVMFLVIFVFVIIVISQIGLVDAFGKFVSSRRKKSYTLQEAVTASSQHFLTVSVVNLLGKGVSLALLAIAALPMFIADTHTGQFVYTLCLYMLVSPVVVLISIWINYTVNDIVLNETNVDEAMQNGWLLLRHNIGTSIELALLVFGVYFLVLVAGQVLGGALALPLVASGSTVEWLIGVGTAKALFYVVYSVMAGVVMIGAVSVFSSWSRGCWTLLYLELAKKKQKSKVYRLLNSK